MPGLPRIPEAPRSNATSFRSKVLSGLEDLEFMPRGLHIAAALRNVPNVYGEVVQILLDSLTPPRTEADEFGLAEFFYLPHSFFIATYGIHREHNGGADPFGVSIKALHALTTRFTAEFAIRPFLIHRQERTLSRDMKWTEAPNPHVRRLCSEGTRPRLPWGKRIPAFIKDPAVALRKVAAA